MLNSRLLIVLSALPDGETALCTALEALAHAGRPRRLRFALPARFQAGLQDAAAAGDVFGEGDVKYFDEANGLSGAAACVTDEKYFLSLRGPCTFTDGWDQLLFARFARFPGARVVMTAVMDGDAETAQAYLPAFRTAEDENGVVLGAGLPLVASAAPVQTLAVHPAFVFSRIGFLANVTTDADTLSIAVYATGYTVCALDRAPLRPAEPLAAARLLQPPPALLPPPSLKRFEQLAGLDFGKGTVSTRARMGLFGVADGYAQRFPRRLTLQNRLRKLLRPSAAALPLMVTAFVDLPGASHSTQSYLLRFSYLKALTSLPLILYTGGESERSLRANFPNTLAYPDNTLLPRTLLSQGMTPAQLFERNKFLLLEHAGRAYPSYGHVAWLDIDALPHPVCPQAMPDFSALTDDRVHIGWVGSEPDLSLIVVPRRLVRPLMKAVEAITQLDTAMKRNFDRRPLLRRLMRRHPELFTLHLLPRRGLLFLSCFPPELLSAPLRRQLQNLPAPVRMIPSETNKKGRDSYV